MNSLISKLFLLILICSCCDVKEVEHVEFLPLYKGEWSTPPSNTPTNKVPDGAICGNGDIGMVWGGTPDKQVFYFSKNDFGKHRTGIPMAGFAM